MQPIKEMKGKRYGRWLVVSFDKLDNNKALWNCICDCGIKASVRGDHLRNGRSRSCGCNAHAPIKHGHNLKYGGKSPTYHSWASIIQRCTNPNYEYYSYYGGRGIKVCDRWRKFENFLMDMGERPKDKTIDRKDNDGDYTPDNCRWGTIAEQNSNKRAKNTALNTYEQSLYEVSKWLPMI